ncbi:MAG: class I SAM-dependent methyltransferase [Thermoanaerobaculia bacterium]|nr:class I SAM-dependent methyltransferase [Thermoanaerobaculia bacterium]
MRHRRERRLCRHLAEMMPRGARVLDVGCGDGSLARSLAVLRPDLSVLGIDTIVRSTRHLSMARFDGRSIPFGDHSFDALLMVDVLHHAAEPKVLLKEARRVARRAIVLKDHLLQGVLAGPTLRFMDRVGNARHGVALPHDYWTPDQWRSAFATLGLEGDWRTSLGLYPWPASWLFDRSLHFLTRLEPRAEKRPRDDRDRAEILWQEAYRRFETPEEEIRKFTRRLRRFGCDDWPRDAHIVELFCGRGSSLVTLERLGFSNLEGVELSRELASRYSGAARVHVGDCRQLPFEDRSKDILIVQGGLHHLPRLPDDLRTTLGEAHRVLRDGGLFLAVEPWDTPFLRTVHHFCRVRWARRLSPKLDALASMIELEAETYFAWLSEPEVILREIDHVFEIDSQAIGWGKLRLRGVHR